MPTAIPFNTSSKKSFKWTAQRITSPKSGRISSPKSSKAKRVHGSEIERLESELAFTYDSLATINVMFDSLRLAYANCKAEIDKSKSETRLGEMEKELLTAYDDLGLQVVHLERQIIKLERQLSQIKPDSHSPPTDSMPSPPQPPKEQPASPASTECEQYPLSYPALPTPPLYTMSSPMPDTSYYPMPYVAQTMPMPESDYFMPYIIPTMCTYDPAPTWTSYPTFQY
ncbi:hypothetical protein DFQ29_001141 [Apophysomyces sp. BC1021]|nr:hypothetical protein DFQ29_001141 [Apophysomyces sp. BC1021]